MVKAGSDGEIVLAGKFLARVHNLSNSIYDISGKPPTINTRCDQTFITTNEATYRKLTPIECERLQTYPDDYTKYGIMNEKTVEISNAQKYKMIGNGFTRDVIAHILSFNGYDWTDQGINQRETQSHFGKILAGLDKANPDTPS